MFIFNADYSDPDSVHTALTETIRDAGADIVPCGWETDVVIGDLISRNELEFLQKRHDSVMVVEADSSRQEKSEVDRSGELAMIQCGANNLFSTCMEQLTFSEKHRSTSEWAGRIDGAYTHNR